MKMRTAIQIAATKAGKAIKVTGAIKAIEGRVTGRAVTIGDLEVEHEEATQIIVVLSRPLRKSRIIFIITIDKLDGPSRLIQDKSRRSDRYWRMQSWLLLLDGCPLLPYSSRIRSLLSRLHSQGLVHRFV